MAAAKPHGTTTAYRKGCRCAKCRGANSRAKRLQRERAKTRAGRPRLSIVDDVHEDVPGDVLPTANSDDRERPTPAYGQTESALISDLESVAPDAPFFGSYRAAALQLAREIDDVDSKASKAPLVKQLVDIIRELKGKDSGDGNSFEELLADLGKPFAGTEDLDTPKS